jgi:hypothetical protein
MELKPTTVVRYSLCSYHVSNTNRFFCNPTLFATCTSTVSKLCTKLIQLHVEEYSVALFCI